MHSNHRAETAVHIPMWRRAIYGLITCTLCFAVIEFCLYAAGVQPLGEMQDPYVSFTSQRPLYVLSGDARTAAWRETDSARLRFFNTQRFRSEKRPGMRRIFCLGGSTTYGHPYDDRTSFCGWLRELLREVAPETEWEVINAGGISYASYRVAALMEELVDYAPDAFIVLSGHNEFLEARTYPDRARYTSLPIDYVAEQLTSSRLFAGLHAMARRYDVITHEAPTSLAPEVDALLDRSIGPSAYSRETLAREEILYHFRLNLRRMAALAKAAGARIVFVVPASNLRDCAPFKAEPDPTLTEERQVRLLRALERARIAQASGKYALAEADWSSALAIDSEHAEALFQLGHVVALRGRPDAAARLWIRARDHDVCPLRAPSDFEDAVRSVARKAGAPLVDFASLVRDLSERDHLSKAPGAELFLDHVHPTPEVHGELAEAILGELVRTGLVVPTRDLDPAVRARVRATIAASRSPEREGIALRNLAKVLSWAGKSHEAARLARRTIDMLGADAESAFILGAQALEQGDDRAAKEWFTEAVELEPGYTKAHTNLGIALARLGDDEGAMRQYDSALEQDPLSATALYNRAGLSLARGDYASALADYRRAAALAPDDIEIRTELAFALLRSGDRSEAAKVYEELTQIPERYPSQRSSLQRLAEALSE